MARPRKGTQATWYDVFQEWSAEDRASAIKVLEQIHRFLLKHDQPKVERGEKSVACLPR